MSSHNVERPWSVVPCDQMEFPPSKFQKEDLIVFQDSYTRCVELKPVRKADDKSLVRAFEELFFPLGNSGL